MPHGGPRVIQKIISRLIELGAEPAHNPPATELYPEASTRLEADMLATLAHAASPAAIDLLLAQPALWRQYLTQINMHTLHPNQSTQILNDSNTLDRLITPPSVLVCGRPNVGKSTLTNHLLGRTASIVADLPGTTRDWVAGLTEFSGIAIRWMDTPGRHLSDDPIENAAIELAAGAIASADLLIAMRDPQTDWPDPTSLPRQPDLWVVNKIDQPSMWNADSGNGARNSPLPISAATGTGLKLLQNLVLDRLGLTDLQPRCWAFSPELRNRLAASNLHHLLAYADAQ
jgi:tRNA modification GTPase